MKIFDGMHNGPADFESEFIFHILFINLWIGVLVKLILVRVVSDFNEAKIQQLTPVNVSMQ